MITNTKFYHSGIIKNRFHVQINIIINVGVYLKKIAALNINKSKNIYNVPLKKNVYSISVGHIK